MPDKRPKLTLIQGGGQPLSEEERRRLTAESWEQLYEKIDKGLDKILAQAKRTQKSEEWKAVQKSWRKPKKSWRP